MTTGVPTGVLRTERMFENFVIELEWRHMTKGGNSGLFVWGEGFTPAGNPYPRGIEVQILDPGFDVPGKNQWYSVHGDIFPVNGAKMTTAGRISPDKQRSFPIEERVLPVRRLFDGGLDVVLTILPLHGPRRSEWRRRRKCST